MKICSNENVDLALRNLELEDDVLLLKWLTDFDVLEYYEGRGTKFDLQAIHKKFYNSNTDVTRCIIEYNGKAIGYLQFYPFDEVEYGIESSDDIIYATDQFIGESEFWNKGIGTELIKMIVEYLVKVKGAVKIFLDPQCKNLRAIACYEKCGFKKVKLLPENELHEGVLEDCWLMEYSVN